MSKEQGIGSRIKGLFLRPKHRSGNQLSDAPAECQTPLVITAEHIQDISRSSPANNRERRILQLTQLVETHRLEETAPDALTNATRDLLSENDPHKRRVALNFIHAIIRGQDEQLGMLRDYYFHIILNHKHHEDQSILLDILNTLTKGGQNLAYIDQQIGDLLVQWLNDYTLADKKTDFLELLVNVIKYNSAFIDEDKAMELFKMSCSICNKTNSGDEIQLCLLVLESIIKYYYLKSAALMPFAMTLSRTVLTESFVQSSWKLMRELLGTHLGYSALFTLTKILQSPANMNDSALLRGAIFFIGMALWGSQRVENLAVSAAAVLPSFKTALISNNTKVAYEVSLTVLRLVRKFGKAQPSIVWDNVLDILDHLHELIKCGSVGEAVITDKISNNLHDILTAIEDLQDSSMYSSCPDRLFSFIEMCASSRPETSVTMLLEHRALSCKPSEEGWLTNLENILNKYHKTETRTAIRLKALNVFNQIIITNRILYEDELLELMLSTFSTAYADPDVSVRSQAVNMLIERAKSCTSNKCVEIIALIQKIVDRKTSPSLKTSGRTQDLEDKCADILGAVTGLIDLFKIKLFEPRGSQAILPLDVIITHLKSHYSSRVTSSTATQIRKLVFSLLLDIRADWSGKVGLEGHAYSSYVYISESYVPEGRDNDDSYSVDVRVLNFTEILSLINTCLLKEVDWTVLSDVLKMMPKQWQNKRLILATENSTIDTICRSLCDLLKVKELRKVINTPANKRFTKSDFDEQIFPMLSCMSAYHSRLFVAKGDLIKCLEFGLLTKCARICVHTLRVCCLEMESIMMKMLPGILNTLSRIVANKTMALPLLMFLSCLVRLPKLYRNFNQDQYKFIFAIALPYTDPSQFQHFAVYLAYHVIVMWFVKCRLMYRKQFVRQIIKSLQTHTKNIKESYQPAHREQLNREDIGDVEKSLTFHQELQETCIDIMSRYAFSNCASGPKRTPVTDFLLEGGRSQSWFVGNKLITITTSGGGSKVTKTGLCQRCTASVRGESAPPPSTDMKFGNGQRKRHKSAYVHTLSDPITIPQGFSQDDMIHNQTIEAISENSGSSSHTQGSSVPAPNQCSSEDFFSVVAQQHSAGRFTLGECNCWCNGWAEIYIHRPSGDTSWILRIQNRQLLNYEEFPFSDIRYNTLSKILPVFYGSIFMPSPHKSPFPSSASLVSQKMIESGSLEEKEYEEQHEKHFNVIASNSTARRKISLFNTEEDTESSGPLSAPVVPTIHLQRTVSSPPTRIQSNPNIKSGGLRANESLAAGSLRQGVNEAREPQGVSRHTQSPGAGTQQQNVIGGGNGSAFTRQTSLTRLNTDESGSITGHGFMPSVSFSQPIYQHIVDDDDEDTPEYDPSEAADIAPMPKVRSHTFSYSATSRLTSPEVPPFSSRRLDTHNAKDMRTGILPNFVFLELYHMGIIHLSSMPIPIPDSSEEFTRGLKNLKRIAPYETHKVGVVYVGKGQASDESAILANTYGSQRYSHLLKRLGTLLSLSACDPSDMYIGGLDHEQGEDGKYTYTWHDEVVQMVFHIATMMPTKANDARCNNKKRHIGNDYVTIVYNDSGEEYCMGTIKGKFNYVNIVVEPLDQVSCAVSVICKEEIKQIMEHVATKVISDEYVTDLVKQIALHSSMASLICERLKSNEFYASNWLERLRQIKRMKDKTPISKQLSEKLASAKSMDNDAWVTDFTEFT